MLARIYGLFTLKTNFFAPLTVMVMQNTFQSSCLSDCILKFDLKGSKFNRKVHRSNKGSIPDLDPAIVYKDADFDNFVGGIFVNQPNLIIEKIISDVKFLEEHHIMDYSLLVMICKPTSAKSPFLFHGPRHTYCIGIIDFLQKFTWQKHAELSFKSFMKDKSLVSAQNPTTYAKRFSKKMIEYLSVVN